MNELQDYRRTLPDVSYEIATIRAELKFRKFMRALKAAFNPDQPRMKMVDGPTADRLLPKRAVMRPLILPVVIGAVPERRRWIS